MTDSVLFFDRFFSCNDKEVSNFFIDSLRLPDNIANILKAFYVDHKTEKEIAYDLSIDERTVRSRLSLSREICRDKAVFWLSNYFISLLNAEKGPK